MYYASTNNWRPGRQTMININPWEPVPYEQANTPPTDNHYAIEYSKRQPEKMMPESRNTHQH
jgi:hypothetical protein